MAEKQKKRKTPTDIIEETEDPSVEHAYMKFPRELPIYAGKGTSQGVTEDRYISFDELAKRNFKGYSGIHNHPMTVNPGEESVAHTASKADLMQLKLNRTKKAEWMACRNQTTGKVYGYLVLKKKKDSNKIKFGVVEQAADEYDKTLRSGPADQENYSKALDKMANACGYQYRFVPTEGYGFDKKRGFYNKSSKLLEPGSLDDYDVDEEGFLWKKEKPSKLEKIAASIMIGFTIAGVALASANLTGLSVSESSKTSQSIIGSLLIILGIIGLFIIKKQSKLSEKNKS